MKIVQVPLCNKQCVAKVFIFFPATVSNFVRKEIFLRPFSIMKDAFIKIVHSPISLEISTTFRYTIIVSMSYFVTCFDNFLFLSRRGRGNNLFWYYVSASWEITPGIVLLGLTKMQIYVMKKAAWNNWYLQRNDILHTLLFLYEAIIYLTYEFVKNTSTHTSSMRL